MVNRVIFRQTGYNIGRLRERMLGRSRPRVIFIHVPKTGGTSIKVHFKSYVGSKRSGKTVRFEDFDGNISAFAERARRARFVTGHMPWSAFRACRDRNTFAFTVLRDPYERMRSLYHFIANLPGSHEIGEEINKMQEMSVEQFLTTTDESIRFYTDNFLARQFSESADKIPKTASDCERLAEEAIANISSLDLVGFNDEIDEIFRQVVDVARLPQPPEGHRVNVTQHLVKSEADKREVSRDFTEELRDLARPLVEADMRVYEHFLERRYSRT